MIHLYLDLFYEVYNTMNQHYQNSLPLIDSSNFSWYLCKKESKRSSVTSSVSLPIMTFMLSLLLYIILVSSESFEEKNLTAIVNGIFHSPLVLRSSEEKT